MTKTTENTVEETPPEPRIEDLITEIVDHYIADVTALGKKWAKDHGLKWGQLPSAFRPSLNSETAQVLNIAIRPGKRLPKNPGIERHPVETTPEATPDPGDQLRRARKAMGLID